jgi:hypothetical protein
MIICLQLGYLIVLYPPSPRLGCNGGERESERDYGKQRGPYENNQYIVVTTHCQTTNKGE